MIELTQAQLDLALERALEQLAAGLMPTVESILPGCASGAAQIQAVLDLAYESFGLSAPKPDELPGYELLRHIGSGGMGSVYLARQLAVSGRIVAIKVMRADRQGSDRASVRMRREIDVLAAISHPAVVRILDVLESRGQVAYAMEYVRGPRLIELMHEAAELETSERAKLLQERLIAPEPVTSWFRFMARGLLMIAEGVCALHERGLVHRDIKPSNLLLREDGSFVLSDFGLARQMADSTVTQTGNFVGTLAYAAPEQLAGSASADGRQADQYALGATLYHLVLLRPTHRARSVADALEILALDRIPRPAKVERSIPADLACIIETALRPEPEQRYRSVRQFADDLRAYLEGRPISAQPLSRVQRMRSLLRRRHKSIRLALGFLALLVGMLALLYVPMVLAPSRAAFHLSQARLGLFDARGGEVLFAWRQLGKDDAYARSVFAKHSRQNRWRLRAAREHYRASALYLRLCGSAPSSAQRLEEAILSCVLERGQTLPLDTREAQLLAREAPVVLQYLIEGAGSDAREASLLQTAVEQDRLLELGLAAYLRVEPHLALAAWKQCTVQLHSNPLVEAALGQAELRGGDPQLAAQHLARALEGFGPIGFLATDMAEAAFLMGDYRSAKRLLAATGTMPAPSPYHREMLLAARLCVLEGDHAGALAHFERLVRLHRYLDVFRPYAALLEHLGRRDHAVCVRYRALDRYRFPSDQRAFLQILWKWVVLDRAWSLQLPPGSKARWAVRPSQFLRELWLALAQIELLKQVDGE